MPSVSTAGHIKAAFKFSRTKSPSRNMSMISHPQYYPDYKMQTLGDRFPDSMAGLEAMMRSIADETKFIMYPIYEGCNVIYDSSKYEEYVDMLQTGIRTPDNPYRHYISRAIEIFSPISTVSEHIRMRASSNNKFVFHDALHRHACSKAISIMEQHGFDIVGFDNANEYGDKNVGMAVMKDAKGRNSFLRIGRAIKKMFPNLPTSFVTHMVEAIKDYFDKVNIKLYVHEGYERIDFLYGYVRPYESNTNPSLDHTYKSLTNSCLRSQIKVPEIGVDNPANVHLHHHIVDLNRHPVEAYASGDFSIIYVSNKEDPHDHDGKIYARVIVGHHQIDKSKLDLNLFEDCDDYVSVSQVYVASEMAKNYIVNYIKDKYKHEPNPAAFANMSTFLSMYNQYNKEPHDNLQNPSNVPTKYRDNLKDAIKRPLRLLAIAASTGEIVTKDKSSFLFSGRMPNEKYNFSYSSVAFLAPYMDVNTSYFRPGMIIYDEDMESPKNNDSGSGVYYSYVADFVINGEVTSRRKLADTQCYTDSYGGYNGYNQHCLASHMFMCPITGEETSSRNSRTVTIVRGNQVERNVMVSIDSLMYKSDDYIVKSLPHMTYVVFTETKSKAIRVCCVSGMNLDTIEENAHLSINDVVYLPYEMYENGLIRKKGDEFYMTYNLNVAALDSMINYVDELTSILNQ